MIVAPSILSADFGHLQRDVQFLNSSEAQWLHVDIMDGIFVPNISFGFPVLKIIAEHSTLVVDVHLMIAQPERYIDTFIENGAQQLSVHYEACTHLHRTLQYIKSKNIQAGIALNPHTPISLLTDCIMEADLVCVMSVNPGFGGQKFIENTYRKVSQLKELILQKNLHTRIEIDGGVTVENAPKLKDCGADVLVAGNTVFGSENPLETISLLRNC